MEITTEPQQTEMKLRDELRKKLLAMILQNEAQRRPQAQTPVVCKNP